MPNTPKPYKPGEVVFKTALPKCDRHPTRDAHYDFATTLGPWMNGCDACFAELGRGRLGVGVGQRLVLKAPAGVAEGKETEPEEETGDA